MNGQWIYTIQLHLQADARLLPYFISDFGFDSFWQTDEKTWTGALEPNAEPVSEQQLYNAWEGIQKVEIKCEPFRNWNEEWESGFQPVAIGNVFYIRASFHAPRPEVQHEIVISPRMTFGTGHHATTRLMLEALAELRPVGNNVLDMGCGTGILGLAALMLGAEKLRAVDNDERACEVTREHLENHGLLRHAEILHQGTVPQDRYDLILANIQLNIILQQLDEYLNNLNEEGVLMISGVMESQAPEVINQLLSYKSEVRFLDGWSLILVRK